MKFRLFIMLLIITFLMVFCKEKDKPYFIWLEKSSILPPQDYEAQELIARISENLITISADDDRYKIVLPKNVKAGIYDASSPDIYFLRDGYTKINSFKLNIEKIDTEEVFGTFEGRVTYEDKSFYDIKNGKFYARFTNE